MLRTPNPDTLITLFSNYSDFLDTLPLSTKLGHSHVYTIRLPENLYPIEILDQQMLSNQFGILGFSHDSGFKVVKIAIDDAHRWNINYKKKQIEKRENQQLFFSLLSNIPTVNHPFFKIELSAESHSLKDMWIGDRLQMGIIGVTTCGEQVLLVIDKEKAAKWYQCYMKALMNTGNEHLDRQFYDKIKNVTAPTPEEIDQAVNNVNQTADFYLRVGNQLEYFQQMNAENRNFCDPIVREQESQFSSKFGIWSRQKTYDEMKEELNIYQEPGIGF